MAIFGAGSNWIGKEVKSEFFNENKFVIGWNENNSKDLYEAISQLKVGDIIYLKSVSPRYIRHVEIGIVTKSFIQCLQSGEYGNTDISDWNALFIKVNWIIQTSFVIDIPVNEGKLTNVRPATFYEEFLPYVQEKIINKLISNLLRV
ncbi:hypothetical protein [Aliivibrio fischeri]|uniref:hypothetical protein n=1 Tax=Aliivibrio fischeri TaxID=668 RepID=UPI00106172AA|nr:hypothetical protein [Aliivibrio fischeri]TDM51386.1 hypothetical protein VFFQA001_14765 [Aliivibrio fischeri]